MTKPRPSLPHVQPERERPLLPKIFAPSPTGGCAASTRMKHTRRYLHKCGVKGHPEQGPPEPSATANGFARARTCVLQGHCQPIAYGLDISMRDLESFFIRSFLVVVDPLGCHSPEREVMLETNTRVQKDPVPFTSQDARRSHQERLFPASKWTSSPKSSRKNIPNPSLQKRIKFSSALGREASARRATSRSGLVPRRDSGSLPPSCARWCLWPRRRFATSDLNDLYRRVIQPQTPVKSSWSCGAPDA